MILVTGATGNAGAEVVRALRARGAQVRAFVRDPDRARERLGGDVELVVGDLADARSVRGALEGAERLLLSCADDPRRVEWEREAIDLAAAGGVRRIVKLSTIGASPDAPVAFWAWHGLVEEHLRAAPVEAVILRSSFYMSNLLAAADGVATEGVLAAPADGARIAMIDPVDVGAAAAAVLTDAAVGGGTHVLTGPEAVTYAGVAAALSAATGREVAFVDVPEDAARAGLVERGVPPFLADQLVAVFRQLRAGAAADVTGTIEALTGRTPRSFDAFACAHADAFRPVHAAGIR